MSDAPAAIGEADLHTHCTVSDGTESPHELVAQAVDGRALGASRSPTTTRRAAGHEAFGRRPGTGLTLIPGMELSTRYGYTSVHMLAYLFDPLDAALVAETARIRESRLHRAEAIVRRIAARLRPRAGTTCSPRPPRARPSAARTSPTRSWRAGTCPTGRRRSRASCTRAAGYYAAALRARPARGRAPHRRGRRRARARAPRHARAPSRSCRRDGSRQLVDAGLFGLEVDHRENRADAKPRLRELAAQFGLVSPGRATTTARASRTGSASTDRARGGRRRSSPRARVGAGLP